MPTRTKLEAEITALATEVEAVARGRGRTLPTPDDLADLMLALGVDLATLRAAEAPGEDQNVRLAALYSPGEVTPAAEALREHYFAVLTCVFAVDRPAYFQALRALPPLLVDLLARRAGSWSERWEKVSRPFELHRGALSWVTGAPTPPAVSTAPGPRPAEWATQSVAKAKGWQRVLLMTLALNVAATELKEWREWLMGEAAQQHALRLHEQANPIPSYREDPAARWAREVAAHTLPEEEEAELVRRGVVTAEELAAVKALPSIPPRDESTS